MDKTVKKIISWIGQVIGSYRHVILLLLAVQVLLSLVGISYAVLLRDLIDHAVSGEKDAFFSNAGILLAVMAGQMALQACNRFLLEFSRSGMENRLKRYLFEKLLSADYEDVTAVHSAEWMNRLTSDTVVVANGLTDILPGVGGMIVKIVGAMVLLLIMEPAFVYILLPGGLCMILFTWLFRKVLKRLHHRIQEADGVLRTFLQEHLENLMIIHSFTRERVVLDMSDQKMEDHRQTRLKRNTFSNLCNIGFGTAMRGAYIGGAIYCAYGILKHTMSYGTLTAVMQLVAQIQNPFANLTGFLPQYYAMLASAERLMEADDFPQDFEEAAEAGNGARGEAGQERAEEELQEFYQNEFLGLGVSDLTFSYKNRTENPVQVFDGFGFEIGKGEHLVLMGPSGCGKSTLLKILLNLYSSFDGERYLLTREGRIPLERRHRGLFAYVPQGNQLMSGTIREIIAFHDREQMRDEAKLVESLTISCAMDFVSNLPEGLDTVLGERGYGLSEGQMQRLAIARAINIGRPILLLDEATSALDERTELQLIHNIKNLTDRTVLIVTHRKAVLEIADQVIEMG